MVLTEVPNEWKVQMENPCYSEASPREYDGKIEDANASFSSLPEQTEEWNVPNAESYLSHPSFNSCPSLSSWGPSHRPQNSLLLPFGDPGSMMRYPRGSSFEFHPQRPLIASVPELAFPIDSKWKSTQMAFPDTFQGMQNQPSFFNERCEFMQSLH